MLPTLHGQEPRCLTKLTLPTLTEEGEGLPIVGVRDIARAGEFVAEFLEEFGRLTIPTAIQRLTGLLVRLLA
jgi:hypothetical protein